MKPRRSGGPASVRPEDLGEGLTSPPTEVADGRIRRQSEHWPLPEHHDLGACDIHHGGGFSARGVPSM